MADLSICEPTEEQKQGYLQRIPLSEVYGDNVLPGVVTNGEAIDAIKDFELGPDDFLIVTYPKTGTTWASEVVSAIAHQGNTEVLKQIRMDERVPWLELSDRHLPEDSPVHSSRRGKASPTAKKRVWFTHVHLDKLPRSVIEGKCKMLYVARNPKDTAVSFYHFHRMAKYLGLQTEMSWAEYFPLFCAGFLCSGSWFKHNLTYWEFCKNNKNAKFIKFEEMKADLMSEMPSLEALVGVPLSDDLRAHVVQHSSFDKMKENKMTNRETTDLYDSKISHFMRKGIIGDWKNYFTVAQNESFDELYKQKFAGSDLTFDFE